MENLLAVTFEAHNPLLNRHRRYEIRIGRDLFGEWTVVILYGRMGRGGGEVRHSGNDPVPLRRLIQDCLRRRLSAPRRIGCQYQLKKIDATNGDIVGDWLSAENLSEFGSNREFPRVLSQLDINGV